MKIAHTRCAIAFGLLAFALILLSGVFPGNRGARAQGVDRPTMVEDSLVSIFENSTLDIQYGFIKDIGDGNGFTAGRAGFTSKTGDMLEVVQEYEKLRPGSMLAKYIAPLKSALHTASTERIAGLESDWPQAAREDPLFRKAQDLVNERLYREPAKAMAQALGLQLPLSRAAIYEVIAELAKSGMAVIVVSSDLEEVLGLSHRVMVMSRGEARGVLPRAEVDSSKVMELAVI